MVSFCEISYILSIVIACIFYFNSNNRILIAILLILFVASIALYLTSLALCHENYGLLFLYLYRVLLGTSGIYQVLSILYCSYWTINIKEHKANYFSSMLIGGHTTAHIYTWIAYGPLVGFILLSAPSPISKRSMSAVALLFNGYTIYQWVIVIVMLIYGVKAIKHYNINLGSNLRFVPKAKASQCANGDGISNLETSAAAEKLYSNDNDNNDGSHEDELHERQVNSDVDGISEEGKALDTNDSLEVLRGNAHIDVLNINTQIFNSINSNIISDRERERSNHRAAAATLVPVALILAICAECLVAMIFFGFYWNILTIGLAYGEIQGPYTTWRGYLAVIFGCIFGILFKWKKMMTLCSRYRCTFIGKLFH